MLFIVLAVFAISTILSLAYAWDTSQENIRLLNNNNKLNRIVNADDACLEANQKLIGLLNLQAESLKEQINNQNDLIDAYKKVYQFDKDLISMQEQQINALNVYVEGLKERVTDLVKLNQEFDKMLMDLNPELKAALDQAKKNIN